MPETQAIAASHAGQGYYWLKRKHDRFLILNNSSAPTSKMNPEEKEYLGDGVYIESDGWGWWLTTLEGSRIYIDGPTDAAKLAKLMGVIK